jgi:hypothetical protein
MAKKGMLAALFVLFFAASLRFAPAAVPDDDCAGTPVDAAMTLPVPLSKWGQISCSPFGHVLGAREGWVWISQNAARQIMIPAQGETRRPQPLGNAAYFVKIDVRRVSGSEFDRVYEIFHVGFDANEPKPDGYRAELTPVKGETLTVYFFDYDTYAWGMECPRGECVTDSRFMILDKAHRPTLRAPAI